MTKKTDPYRLAPAGTDAPASVHPQLREMPGLEVYPRSQAGVDGALYFLARTADGERRVGVIAPSGHTAPAAFAGEASSHGEYSLVLAPLQHVNARALRAALPWLQPRPIGLLTSAGCGDRLGMATPGHVRAAAAVARRHGTAPAMIFAQQSIREMARTGRTPDEVMDDATFGTFQEGWRAGVGADADHLKTPADVDRCVAAGFTFFTVDPGEHVDSSADSDGAQALRSKYEALPWGDLDTSASGLLQRYEGRHYDLPDTGLVLDEALVVRAAVKYGRAVAHTARMYRHLAGLLLADAWELEVSVDETDTPTSHAEHIFVASELRRMGVNWVSLAPRYVGRFEKGVDYIPPEGRSSTDLGAFERDFAGHAAIAQLLGPYKLSLHSGSDKFSIYGIAARYAQGLLHLKTAGTSYVEALRAVAGFDPGLFRDIYAFAVSRYEVDRASYHVSAELSRVPHIEQVPDNALPDLLDNFDARQVLHVTFGSVLTSDAGYRARLFADLDEQSEAYYEVLERHFVRHLEPLVLAA
jgi:tagaturonate epimerase